MTAADKRFDLVSCSFRLFQVQNELIAEAAENAGISLSDYARDVLTADAAARLGKPIPVVPPIVRGRGASLVAQAAAKLGLSRQEFEALSAQAYAAQTLGLEQVARATTAQATSHVTKHESGMRPAARTGSR